VTAHYRFDPSQSRFTVQAFATGLLSFAGHSPTFAVRDFRGGLDLDLGSSKVVALELTTRAEGLDLLGNYSASDRREIETRMRRDVLQTSAFPEVTFEAADVAAAAPIAPGRYRIDLNGRLSLHGVTRPHRIVAELQVLDDALRLLGDCPLRMSEYRISPVTALGGTIRLKDELAVKFDLIGLREGP
jgi:polyisoprenoid-binding protein YceI